MGFAAAIAFIGYGLFQMLEWARITTIVIAGIGFAGAIFGFTHPIYVGRFSLVVRMAVDGFIIWYLVQPQIAASFLRG